MHKGTTEHLRNTMHKGTTEHLRNTMHNRTTEHLRNTMHKEIRVSENSWHELNKHYLN
jgi:hypothetical protein